jgi:hypothetical protein
MKIIFAILVILTILQSCMENYSEPCTVRYCLKDLEGYWYQNEWMFLFSIDDGALILETWQFSSASGKRYIFDGYLSGRFYKDSLINIEFKAKKLISIYLEGKRFELHK